MNLFKKEEAEPLHSPVIEMRKSSRSYVWWVISAIIIVLILVFFWPK